jgi:hypothetical protein
MKAFLVECVSCTVQCSGQHGCAKCGKVVCNFCRGFGEENKLCYVCKNGIQRAVGVASAEGAPPGAPPEALPAVLPSAGAHQLGLRL